MADYLVYFTDPNLVAIGQPLDGWNAMQLVLRFNDVGTGTLTMPASGDVIELNQPGNRVVVVRNDAILCAGPIMHPDDFDQDSAGGDQAAPGQITIVWEFDEAALAYRLCYPDPAHAATAQTAAKDTGTAVNAETAMRHFVDKNIGAGALVARRWPQLALGAVASVGTALNYSARFDVLSDMLRRLASQDGLGYRLRQTSTPALVLEVYAPIDRSGDVRFSFELGNLQKLSYRETAPTANVAIVGGDGTGTSRTVVEVADAVSVASGWGRRETFVNDSSTDTTELTQNGTQAIQQAVGTVLLTATAIDDARQRFGTDYGLGDRVSIEVRPGKLVTDIVTAVVINVDASGEVVSPTIGTGAPTSNGAILRQLRAVLVRLGVLERAD